MYMIHRYALLPIPLIATLIGSAQTGVLNSSEMLPPGSIETQRVMSDVDILDTTVQGQNVDWDFTAITPSGAAPYNNEYMLPSSTPHPTTFPASNYVVYETEIPRYSYFSLTSASLARVGGWTTVASTYSDPQVERTFPLAYGTSNSDTWDNDQSSFGGTYDFTCIGTGTLELPGHTYSDVLLVRGNLHELFNIYFYAWYDATSGATLVLYYPGDGVFVPTAAAYTTSVSVGVQEVGADLGLRIHTLVHDRLPVTYTSAEPLDWSIVDASGKRLANGRFPATSDAVTEFVDVAQLPAGLYIIDLLNERSRQTARFVVE
jgi:hypothetical protein